MKRKEFIQSVEKLLKEKINKEQYFDFCLHVSEEQKKENVTEALVDTLNHHFNESIVNDNIVFAEPDWLAMEDEDDWIYRIRINIHKYYDQLFPENEMKKVYRLENKSGKGVYEITGGKGLMNEDKYVPELDNNLNFLFDITKLNDNFYNQYKKQWNFGCMSKEQLWSWIDKNEHTFLSSKDIQVVEIDVPENYLIEGDFQCIFIKEKATIKQFQPIESFLKDMLVSEEKTELNAIKIKENNINKFKF